MQNLTILVGIYGCSEKGELDDVAAAKIEKLTAELEKPGDFNPVQRIVDGFIHFRTNKFE